MHRNGEINEKLTDGKQTPDETVIMPNANGLFQWPLALGDCPNQFSKFRTIILADGR